MAIINLRGDVVSTSSQDEVTILYNNAYTDAMAVDAVEFAGLTMGANIDLVNNLIVSGTTSIKSGSGGSRLDLTGGASGVRLTGNVNMLNDLDVDGSLNVDGNGVIDGTLTVGSSLTYKTYKFDELYAGGPYIPQLKINTPYDVTSNNIPALMSFKLDDGTNEAYIGAVGWAHRANGKDRYEITHIDDTDPSIQHTLARMAYNDTWRFSITGDVTNDQFMRVNTDGSVDFLKGINVVVDDTIFPNAGTFISLLDGSDGVGNAFRTKIQYDSGTLADGDTVLITMQAQDGTSGLVELGNFSCTYRTSGDHEFDIVVSGNSAISINPNRAEMQMPFKFVTVDLSSWSGTPETGMAVIDSNDSNKLKVYDGSTWQAAW